MLISTDEDLGLQIESFAIIKIRGVTTKYKLLYFSPCNHTKIVLILLRLNDLEK